MSATLAGLAVPGFWFALLLTLLFSLKLRWLPGRRRGRARGRGFCPSITLALPTTAIVARLVRSGMAGTLRSEYVRTAHAKGVPGRQVLTRHALRTSLTPAVSTVLGLHLGHLLGGAFVVETIFGWPGLGRLTVQAIFDRDTPVVLGCALAIAAMYLLVNLARRRGAGVARPARAAGGDLAWPRSPISGPASRSAPAAVGKAATQALSSGLATARLPFAGRRSTSLRAGAVIVLALLV